METPLNAREFLKRFHLPQLVRLDPNCIKESSLVENSCVLCTKGENGCDLLNEEKRTNLTEAEDCSTSLSSSFLASTNNKQQEQQHEKSDWTYRCSAGDSRHQVANESDNLQVETLPSAEFDQSTFMVQQEMRQLRRRRQQQQQLQQHHHHHQQQQHSASKNLEYQMNMRLTPPSKRPTLSKLTLNQPFLLYKAYKKFELCAYVIDAKNELNKKSGDPVYFPQNYPGWFSICLSSSKQNLSRLKHLHGQSNGSPQEVKSVPFTSIGQVCQNGGQIFLTRDEITGYRLPPKLSQLTKLKDTNQLLALPLAINLEKMNNFANLKSTRKNNDQGGISKDQHISDISQIVINAGQVLKICGIYENMLPRLESQTSINKQQQNLKQVIENQHQQHILNSDSLVPQSYMYESHFDPVMKSHHQMATKALNGQFHQQMAQQQHLQFAYNSNEYDFKSNLDFSVSKKKAQKLLKMQYAKSNKLVGPSMALAKQHPSIPNLSQTATSANFHPNIKTNKSSQQQSALNQPIGQRYVRCIVMNQKSVDRFTNCINPRDEEETKLSNRQEEFSEEEIEVLIPMDQRGRFYMCATTQSIVSELYCTSCSTGCSNLIFRMSQIVALLDLSHRLAIKNKLLHEQKQQLNCQNFEHSQALGGPKKVIKTPNCEPNHIRLPLTVQLITGPRPQNFSPSMFGTSSRMESYFNCENNIGGHLISCKYNKNFSDLQKTKSGKHCAHAGSLGKQRKENSNEKDAIRSSMSGPACFCAQWPAPPSVNSSKSSESYGNFSALLRIERVLKRDVLLACTIKQDPLIHMDLSSNKTTCSNINPVAIQQGPAMVKKANQSYPTSDTASTFSFSNKEKLLALRESTNLVQSKKGLSNGSRTISEAASSSFSRLKVCRSLITFNGRKKKKRPNIPTSMLPNLPIHNHLQFAPPGGAAGGRVEFLDDGSLGGANEVPSTNTSTGLNAISLNDKENSIPTSTIPDLVLNRMDYCQKNSLSWERQLKLSYGTLSQDFDTFQRQMEDSSWQHLKLIQERQRNSMIIDATTINRLRESPPTFNNRAQSSLELSNLGGVFPATGDILQATTHNLSSTSNFSLTNEISGATLVNNSRNNSNSTTSSRSSSGVSSGGEKQANGTRDLNTNPAFIIKNKRYDSNKNGNSELVDTASGALSLLSSNSSSSSALGGAPSGKRSGAGAGLLLRLVQRILPANNSSRHPVPDTTEEDMGNFCNEENCTATTGTSSTTSTDNSSEHNKHQRRVLEELNVKFKRELQMDCSSGEWCESGTLMNAQKVHKKLISSRKSAVKNDEEWEKEQVGPKAPHSLIHSFTDDTKINNDEEEGDTSSHLYESLEQLQHEKSFICQPHHVKQQHLHQQQRADQQRTRRSTVVLDPSVTEMLRESRHVRRSVGCVAQVENRNHHQLGLGKSIEYLVGGVDRRGALLERRRRAGSPPAQRNMLRFSNCKSAIQQQRRKSAGADEFVRHHQHSHSKSNHVEDYDDDCEDDDDDWWQSSTRESTGELLTLDTTRAEMSTVKSTKQASSIGFTGVTKTQVRGECRAKLKSKKGDTSTATTTTTSGASSMQQQQQQQHFDDCVMEPVSIEACYDDFVSVVDDDNEQQYDHEEEENSTEYEMGQVVSKHSIPAAKNSSFSLVDYSERQPCGGTRKEPMIHLMQPSSEKLIEEKLKIEEANANSMVEGNYVNLTWHNNRLQQVRKNSLSSQDLNSTLELGAGSMSQQQQQQKQRVVVGRMERKLNKIRGRSVNKSQDFGPIRKVDFDSNLDLEHDTSTDSDNWYSNYENSVISILNSNPPGSLREKHYYNEHEVDYNLGSIRLPPTDLILKKNSNQLNKKLGWTSLVALTTSKSSAFKSIDALSKEEQQKSLAKQDGSSKSSSLGQEDEVNDSFATSSSFGSVNIHEHEMQHNPSLEQDWPSKPPGGASGKFVNSSLDGAIMMRNRQQQHAINSLSLSLCGDTFERNAHQSTTVAAGASKQAKEKLVVGTSSNTTNLHSTDSSLRATSSSNNSTNELAELEDDDDDEEEEEEEEEAGEGGEDWTHVNDNKSGEYFGARQQQQRLAFEHSATKKSHTVVGQVTVANPCGGQRSFVSVAGTKLGPKQTNMRSGCLATLDRTSSSRQS